jgi:hypothetical protein
MARRLRVFEAADGTRFVLQFTLEQFNEYVAANPELKVIR